MFKRVTISILAFFLILSISSTCIAEVKDVKKPGPWNKLEKGLINVLTGWMEIPWNLADSFSEKTPGAIVEEGLFNGIFRAISRTVSGIIDAVTFLLPPYDRPLMKPLENV